jgi:hypothetical protein
MKLFGQTIKQLAVLVAVTGFVLVTSAGVQPDDGKTDLHFDLSRCEFGCKMRFGQTPFAEKLDDGVEYVTHQYTECLQKCNERFWKEFDKEMDEKPKPRGR